ncbi:MAG: hypothetical protein LUG83_07200, partial [Lachnospiraceae bacterium]|nr:hypothetical protein [Lachnospiraceae bacterium]
MKSVKRGLAMLLTVLLIIPSLPARAEGAASEESAESDAILFNTGNYAFKVTNADVSDNEIGDVCFEADGSYTINIPEANPFFPYEVQFTCDGEVTNQLFMTPDDTV